VYAGAMLLARVDGVIGDTQAKKYWYHTDQVGSVKAVTNQAGAVVWNADYLPFGQEYMRNKLDSDFEEDDLGFTGKGYDSDVGLYYFNARWYDADTGRFISEDPVGDPSNPNLYTYGRNNPLSFNDPTGLESTNPGHISTTTSGSTNYGWNNGSGDTSGGNTGPDGPGHGSGADNTNVTTKYYEDGKTLKSVRTSDNNSQTTVYYNKDDTINHVSTFDSHGMQTLTYYRENGAISKTTFNSRGDMVGYSKVDFTSRLSPGRKTPSNTDNTDLTDITESESNIIVDSKATPEQLKDYEEAINYLLENSPKFRELYQKIQNGDIKFYVRFSDYSDYTHIDLVKGKWVITWDRISALYVKSKRAYQNSALGLAHEFGHAVQVIENNYLNQNRDQREEDNLSTWETPIAKELGLPYRNNYKDGRLIRTTGGPLSTVDANPSKGIYKLIDDLFNL
jgi:RHS repeat-associated protein